MIGLVRGVKCGLVEVCEALANTVFVKIEQPIAGPRQMLPAVDPDRIEKDSACFLEPAADQEDIAEHGKRPGIGRLGLGDREYEVVRVGQTPLFGQQEREFDLGGGVCRGYLKNTPEKCLGLGQRLVTSELDGLSDHPADLGRAGIGALRFRVSE